MKEINNRKYLGVAEASERSGLGEHTLRYYDRLGLIPGLKRSSGRRVFSEEDLAALSLVACLRDTGMPLKSIRDFMQATGPKTPDTRLAILQAHRKVVLAKLEDYRKASRRIDFKIWYYEEAKRLGGVDKMPPLSDLIARYHKETGKPINW